MATMFGQLLKRFFPGSAPEAPASAVSKERIAAALRDRSQLEKAQRPRALRITDDSKVVMGNCYVIDGNKVKVGDTIVRLMGVSAPEPHEPFGHEAKWTLHHMCMDEIVTAQITDKDAKGTPVGICYLQDGRDLAAELVKKGLALDWPYFSKDKYAEFEPEGARKTLSQQDAKQQELRENVKRGGRRRKMPAW